MKTKIFYNNRQINGRFDSLKAKFLRLVRFTVRWSLISAAAYAIFMAGAMLYSTSTVTASVPQVTTVDPVFVVLNRIADCESGNGKAGSATHYKNGQVLMRSNTNHTIDIGKYQVNLTYWGAQATKLGYDLTKEEDNYQMARWIYLNKGTTDWSASMKCWYR